MNKFLLLIILSFLSVLHLHANVQERLTSLEESMKDIYLQTDQKSAGALFAHAKEKQNPWTIDAELLLWHAKSGDCNWVIVFDQVVDPLDGSMDTLGFSWNFGLRAGASKHYTHDDWNLGLVYTYYHTDDSTKVEAPFATPESFNGIAGSRGVASGRFSARLSYNALDLCLGKSYFTSSNLRVAPYIGLKNLWLGENYKLKIFNQIDDLQSLTPVQGTVNNSFQNTSHIWGIGPEVGTHFSWFLCNQFSITATAEAALVHSYFKVRHKAEYFVSPVGFPSVSSEALLHGSIHSFIPYGRLLLGFGWDKTFYEDTKTLSLSLSYEVNYFWRASQMLNQKTSDPSPISITFAESTRLLISRFAEDLQLYGVTFQVQYSF